MRLCEGPDKPLTTKALGLACNVINSVRAAMLWYAKSSYLLASRAIQVCPEPTGFVSNASQDQYVFLQTTTKDACSPHSFLRHCSPMAASQRHHARDSLYYKYEGSRGMTLWYHWVAVSNVYMFVVWARHSGDGGQHAAGRLATQPHNNATACRFLTSGDSRCPPLGFWEDEPATWCSRRL